jgi:rRNA maturation protein Nop10
VPDQPNIFVTQNNTNQGCLGGCGTAIGVVLLVGLAVQYWYISATVAVITLGVGIWYWRTQHQPQIPAAPPPAAVAAGSPTVAPAERTCANCGEQTAGNFCATCGTAAARVCAGCGARGLMSPYCPECGAATYTPPSPS